MNTVQKILLALFLLILTFLVSFRIFYSEKEAEQLPVSEAPSLPSDHQTEPLSESTPPVISETLPKVPEELYLSVPFTPQAPTANWDELHNEACEEASALMTASYFSKDNRATLPATEVEQEIQKLTAWQKQNFGYSLSINAEEFAHMINSVYNLKAEVSSDVSEEALKTALATDTLVVVPVNGRALSNPHFQSPGPLYHMFVVKGYTQENFIVNDPGTKHGKDYQYSYQTIRDAIGDYDHKTKKTDPEKPVVILISQ